MRLLQSETVSNDVYMDATLEDAARVQQDKPADVVQTIQFQAGPNGSELRVQRRLVVRYDDTGQALPAQAAAPALPLPRPVRRQPPVLPTGA